MMMLALATARVLSLSSCAHLPVVASNLTPNNKMMIMAHLPRLIRRHERQCGSFIVKADAEHWPAARYIATHLLSQENPIDILISDEPSLASWAGLSLVCEPA